MTRHWYRHLIWLVLSIVWVTPLAAQDTQAQAQLSTDNLTVQTGQFYEVRIDLRDVVNMWSGDFLINYDPAAIYVVGTDSGSPIRLADFLTGGQSIFNFVSEPGKIQFTPTLFNPSDPVSGSGTLATLQIFPLQAGTTQLRFESVSLSSVTFTTNDEGQRIPSQPSRITVLPILLELTVAGDLATPPPEATATPTPTMTSTPAPNETAVPTATLFNATPIPATPVPEVVAEPTSEGIPTILLVAIALIAISGIGLVVLLIVARRR